MHSVIGLMLFYLLFSEFLPSTVLCFVGRDHVSLIVCYKFWFFKKIVVIRDASAEHEGPGVVYIYFLKLP